MPRPRIGDDAALLAGSFAMPGVHIGAQERQEVFSFFRNQKPSEWFDNKWIPPKSSKTSKRSEKCRLVPQASWKVMVAAFGSFFRLPWLTSLTMQAVLMEHTQAAVDIFSSRCAICLWAAGLERRNSAIRRGDLGDFSGRNALCERFLFATFK